MDTRNVGITSLTGTQGSESRTSLFINTEVKSRKSIPLHPNLKINSRQNSTTVDSVSAPIFQQIGDPSRFEIGRTSPQKITVNSLPSSFSLDTPSHKSSPQDLSTNQKVSSPKNLGPLAISLEALKEDLTFCTIYRVFDLKDPVAEEQFLIENGATDPSIHTILQIKRAFFHPIQEGKKEILIELFCAIDNADLRDSLSYSLDIYRHDPRYQELVKTVQSAMDKITFKGQVARLISFSEEAEEEIKQQIKDYNSSFDDFQDFISFFIISHIVSLEDRIKEKSFLRAVANHPFLSGYHQFVHNTLCIKHLFEDQDSANFPKKLKEFFSSSDNIAFLRSLSYYLTRQHKKDFDPHFFKELKEVIRKKQLYAGLSECLGEKKLQVALKRHSESSVPSAEDSWETFQKTMGKIFAEYIFQQPHISPHLQETLKRCAFDEEHQNTLEICINTQQAILTMSPSQIPEKLMEIFKTLQDPECLQNIVYPLRRISSIPQRAIETLTQVSFKKNLLRNSWQYLALAALSPEDQNCIQRAVNDPQIDRLDFMEQLAFLTIEQTFASKNKEHFAHTGTLRTQILSIKEALLESTDPEKDLLAIAEKIKKPELFMQIAHYLFTKKEWEKHQIIIQVLQQKFPVYDITVSEKALFHPEKGEWVLEPARAEERAIHSRYSSFYSLPQETWDLLQTRQLDLAAEHMQNQGAIWREIAPLLAQRKFTAIYEILKSTENPNSWKDIGVRLFLLLGQPNFALKLYSPPLEVWDLLEAQELETAKQQLKKQPGSWSSIITLFEKRQFMAIYENLKEIGHLTPWQKVSEGIFTLLGKSHLISKLSEIHSFYCPSEQRSEKFAIILRSILINPFIDKAYKIDMLNEIIRYISSWEYDPWKSYLCLLLINDFELQALELAGKIMQSSYREAFYDTLLAQGHFSFAWKLLDREPPNSVYFDRLQKKIERSLVACKNPNQIIRELRLIHHYYSSDAPSSRFCENVLRDLTQSWIQQMQQSPETIKQSLRTFRYALQKNSHESLKTIVCKEWGKAIPTMNSEESPFFENFIKLSKTIETYDSREALYEFCFSENRQFLIKPLIALESYEDCKKTVCLRLFREGSIDDALFVLNTMKNLFLYESNMKALIDLLLSWNTEEQKELFNLGLQKILTELKKLPQTLQSDLLKYRTAMTWINNHISPEATQELMMTIKDSYYQKKIQVALETPK